MLGSAVFRTGIAPGGALAPGWVKNELWRKARTVPSLDLRFAENKSLVDAVTGAQLVTFTRASSGTFVGSDGLLKTAVTNLLLRSEEFDNASWSGAGGAVASAGSSIAPNGTATADTLTDTNGTTASPFVFQTVTLVDSTTYTMSCYLKAGTKSTARLGIRDKSGAGLLSNFDLSAGTTTIGSAISSSIQSVGNGWYRCIVTAGSSTGVTSQRALIYIDTASYTADGTGTILVWGAQLEQSSTVGEYIPTTSTINSAPRFDHNPTTGESLGLLPEEAKTNNLLQSEDFSSTWTSSNIAVTTNSVVAPDGTTTADTIAPPADGLTVTRFLRQNPILITQQAYTLSVFAKVGTATTNGITLYVSDSTATNIFRANFNLFTLITSVGNTGWAAPTATIVPYPNGWYRCILTGVTSTVHVSLRAQIYLSAFGTTPDTYGSIHVWGAQLEAGAFPTSYIPTTTATVTRAADVASITGSNFSPWYNQTEGTVFAEFTPRTFAQACGLLSLDDGTTSERLQTRLSTAGSGSFLVADGGSVQANFSTTNSTVLNTKGKLATSFALNSFQACLNGESVASDTLGTLPTVTQAVIGNAVGAFIFNGPISRLTYWPTRLANSTHQAITQP